MSNNFITPFLLSLILLVSSCGSSFDSFEEKLDQEDYVNIKLNLGLDSTNATRETSITQGNEDENYLGVPETDYQIFVFNNTGKYLGEVIPTAYTYPTAESTAKAILEGRISQKLLDGNTALQLMVVVNGKSFNFPSIDLSDNNLTGILSDKNSYNFSMYERSPISTWLPSASGKRGIPMFGISDMQTLPSQDLANQTLIFHVNLLRCVAKISVENKFPQEYDYKILSIALSDYNRKGKIMPDEWKDFNNMIVPSLPWDPNAASNLNLKKLTGDQTTPETWIVYIPEADYRGINPKPFLKFTIGSEGTDKTFEKELPLFGYEDQDSNLTGTILRNHIYEYSVKITNKEITLEYTVCPWYNGYNAEFDYQ